MTVPLILLVVGGDPDAAIRLPAADGLAAGAVVVAADSGLDRARAAGLAVDHAVGDFDSVTAEALAAAEADGTTVHRHPTDKDATDLELALDLVEQLDPGHAAELLVVGAGGGRLDHQLADLLALAGLGFAGRAVRARFGPADVAVVHPGGMVGIAGTPGEQVSLLPVHGVARGVTTEGLRWRLVDADLRPGTTRALSNELLATEATVSVGAGGGGGAVLVVQPGTRSGPIAPRTTPYDPTPTAT